MYAKIYGHAITGFEIILQDHIDWHDCHAYYDFYNGIFYPAIRGELAKVSPELEALIIETAKKLAQRAEEGGLYGHD